MGDESGGQRARLPEICVGTFLSHDGKQIEGTNSTGSVEGAARCAVAIGSIGHAEGAMGIEIVCETYGARCVVATLRFDAVRRQELVEVLKWCRKPYEIVTLHEDLFEHHGHDLAMRERDFDAVRLLPDK